jgi:hypothetical protein
MRSHLTLGREEGGGRIKAADGLGRKRGIGIDPLHLFQYQMGLSCRYLSLAPSPASPCRNSDSLADYSAFLISGAEIGTHWGGFAGADYFEVKIIRIEFIAPLEAAVPILVAAWLFGSGILGLATMARRKRRRE